MEILKQLQSFLGYSFFDVSLGRITGAVFAFFLILLLRRLFTRVVLGMVALWTRKTRTSIDDKIIDIISPPLRFVFIPLALLVFGSVLQLPDDAEEFLTHIARSLVAVAVVWAAYRSTDVLSFMLERWTARTETLLDDHLLPLVQKAVRTVVIVLGSVILVQEWGYDVGGIIAGLGLGGLAFALAAKDSLANFFGCLVLLIDRPFAVGDWIQTDHVEGTVEEISLRSTRVRTFAQALVSVPNSTMAGDAITNWSRMGKRRIKFNLGVTYGTSRKQMAECLSRIETMLRNHPEIHPDTIFVQFTDFGDSALEIFLYFFTKTTVWAEYLKVRSDVNLKVMEILEELGMSVAFPSRSLYLERTSVTDEMAGSPGRGLLMDDPCLRGRTPCDREPA